MGRLAHGVLRMDLFVRALELVVRLDPLGWTSF
jgi:hypothetical protein